MQLCFDAAAVTASVPVVGLGAAAASVLGVAVLNAVLAMNHRPGRYVVR